MASDKGKVKSVLFVCTGNSCRSQMAEGYLKKVLADIGKKGIEVRSAGLAAYEGDPAAETAVMAMKACGVDISGNKTKPVTDELIETSDLILAMTVGHHRELKKRFPDSANKIYLLREFEDKYNPKDPDVFDPVGLPIHAYENCFAIMRNPIEKVAGIL